MKGIWLAILGTDWLVHQKSHSQFCVDENSPPIFHLNLSLGKIFSVGGFTWNPETVTIFGDVKSEVYGELCQISLMELRKIVNGS